jgi:hypothetical protein
MISAFGRLTSKIEHHLRAGPKWSRLRTVGNSVPVKLTILIPLVGYLIIFNDKVIEYLHLIREMGGHNPDTTSAVSPRLLLVYFGLCALALGTAIYSYLCPDQVKHYASSAAYVGGDGPTMKDGELERVAAELKEFSPVGYLEFEEKFGGFFRLSIRPHMSETEFRVSETSKEQSDNALLHFYFRYLDVSHTTMRWIALISYITGFVCLLIPSAGVFIRVMSILWATAALYPWSFI